MADFDVRLPTTVVSTKESTGSESHMSIVVNRNTSSCLYEGTRRSSVDKPSVSRCEDAASCRLVSKDSPLTFAEEALPSSDIIKLSLTVNKEEDDDDDDDDDDDM
jgi:hypothetical protein